jgi:hypothetical protein
MELDADGRSGQRLRRLRGRTGGCDGAAEQDGKGGDAASDRPGG